VRKDRFGIYFVAVTALYIFQAGCSYHMGNKKITDETLHSKIERGVTTKEEIRSLFGKPTHITFTDNDEEIWTYFYTKSETRPLSYVPIIGLCFGGADMHSSTLTIRYGKDDIVKNYGSGVMDGGGGGIQDITK
jgi:outer membrane protein assembly factor BamE (lipoprotein component of BamABCDE complex)